MPVHIFDLDGTLVYHGTNNPLPGAVEMLRQLKAAGDEIIICTRRGDREFRGDSRYGALTIRHALASLEIGFVKVIDNIGSPRIIYNDEECSAVKRETNQEWTP